MYTIEIDENVIEIYMSAGEFENDKWKIYSNGKDICFNEDSNVLVSMDWETFMSTYILEIVNALEYGRKNKDYVEIFVGIWDVSDY